MLFFRKLLKLPSPVDLGWSHHNALEDEMFSDHPKGKTWQDWHRTVKKMHPIKYFIAETLADWLRYKIWFSIKRPVSKAYYWFVSHAIPSRRYHMLDLRQEGGYRYGWRDVPEKMLYAMFNLLGEYLNKEDPTDLTEHYTIEQINNEPNLKAQQDALEEAREIYYWWTVGRKDEKILISVTQDLWWTAKKKKDPIASAHFDLLKKLEAQYEEREDEMVLRLMKIRRTLWT